MCHGHPRYHPCSHTSINWHWCPAALIDLETGYETPCSNISFAAGQQSNLDCPLQNCQFKTMGGSWTCCRCNQGPNTKGWCSWPKNRTAWNPLTLTSEEVESTCDHGCCSKCTQFAGSREPTPGMDFSDLRKGSASRKFGYGSASRSHRRGSAFSLVGGFPSVSEEGSSASSSTSISKSSSSSHAKYSSEMDYSATKSKSSKKRHKSKK